MKGKFEFKTTVGLHYGLQGKKVSVRVLLVIFTYNQFLYYILKVFDVTTHL